MKNLQLLQFQLVNKLKANAELKTKLTTKGTLVPSRLAHHRTSKLLFSQPMPNTGKKYKCEFLLDVSGSMYRRQMSDAVATLQNLIRLFYGVIDFKITCFGDGSFPMSAREILSINLDLFGRKGSDQHYSYSLDLFNRSMSIETFNGQNHLIPFDGGCQCTGNSTWGVGAVAKAGHDLMEEDGERFTIIITDGGDNFPSTINDDKESFACGVSTTKYNSRSYSLIEEEYKEAGLNLLPIGIGGNTPRWSNSFSLDQPDDVYEKIINFIDTHFNK